MNRRERFIQTMTFGAPDRPASGDYFYYESTRERWEREGLPVGADLNEYFGLDFDPFAWQVKANAISVLPGFPEEVIETTEEHIVCRRSEGEVVRILRHVPPPAMPQWITYPLRSRGDWEKYKLRLDPDTPGRLPENLDELAEEYRHRDYPLGMWVGGSYGVMREWWGVEALSMLFYDDSSLIEEMMEHLTYLAVTLLERVLSHGIGLDWVMFWEDMAYKTGPLVSPVLFKKYCIPFYSAIMNKARAAGVPVVMVDSDGNIGELIPLWLDAGVTVMHPMEVAAGMNVIEMRDRYGHNIGFFGGIDKRALAGTREQIYQEVVPKLEVCLEQGGFIPACDHAIPPDVSLDNYRYFRDLVREISRTVFGV